jgi:hypothetical protein
MAEHVSRHGSGGGGGGGGGPGGGAHSFQRSARGATGHSTGSTQHVPTSSGPQLDGTEPPRRAHEAPAPQSDGARHVSAVSTHSPGVAADCPEARRRQSLKYVIPSHPQTGCSSAGQLTGNGLHVPAGSPQRCRSQYVPGAQSCAATQRGAGRPRGPPSPSGSVARTTGSPVHAGNARATSTNAAAPRSARALTVRLRRRSAARRGP